MGLSLNWKRRLERANRCCMIASLRSTIMRRADGYGYQQVAKMDAIGTPPKQGTLARSALYLLDTHVEVARAKSL